MNRLGLGDEEVASDAMMNNLLLEKSLAIENAEMKLAAWLESNEGRNTSVQAVEQK